ncbi:hypothetical protein C4G84_RS13540 [Vibrio parahaemolyticus O5:K30]|uniref:hypothetical protein n=1 Tax=Vibrio parahaemolyticus TaxID=670 RepID=UPI0033550FEE|nr:hypothetical protein [Vibrio parahaemolyticus]EJG0764840.1 hypothetical protein [Vibrio parahaemolyticus O5:K30]MBE4779884.1 hypothetical protein [Vibrio parahaemolyticus]
MLQITNISKNDFLNRIKTAYEAVSGSKLGRKGQNVVNRMAVIMLHGDESSGHNDHTLDKFFITGENSLQREVILLQVNVIGSTSLSGEDFVFYDDSFSTVHGNEKEAKKELKKVVLRYFQEKYRTNLFSQSLRHVEAIQDYFQFLRFQEEQGSAAYFEVADLEEKVYQSTFDQAMNWVFETFTIEDIADGKFFDACMCECLEFQVTRTVI